MSSIPQDLDATMWDIANRHDHQAAADFSQRFPALAPEMATRMEAVQGLRGYRAAIAPSFVPAFKPRFQYKPRGPLRKYGPTAAGLAMLAAASYYVALNLTTPLPNIPVPPAPAVEKPPLVLEPQPVPQAPAKDINDSGPVPFHQEAGHQPAPAPEVLGHAAFDHVPLLTALKAIAEKGSIELTIPDQFPNPEVTADVTGKDALDMMQQLGAQYGFSAFSQGRGKVLLIPAVDTATPSKG